MPRKPKKQQVAPQAPQAEPQTEATRAAVRSLSDVDVDLFSPSPHNPRTINRKSPEFLELVESVRKLGVLQPVQCRPHPTVEGRFELLAGERRVLAALLAKRPTVPAVVHVGLDDRGAVDIVVVENEHREDLTPLEQGRACQSMLEVYRGDVAAVASKLGLPPAQVRARAHLKKLSKKWLKALEDPEAPQGIHAMTVAHLALVCRYPEAVQEEVLRQAEDAFWRNTPSVAEFERWLGTQFEGALAAAPFDTADPGLDPKAGPCALCPKRTSQQGQLFLPEDLGEAELAKADRCLDRGCYLRKVRAAARARFSALKAQAPQARVILTDWTSYATDKAVEETYGEQPMGKETYDLCHETAQGAVPAIVGHGKGEGETKWIKPRPKGSGRGASRGSGPKSLAERREALQKRRDVLFCRLVEEKLKKADGLDPELKDAHLNLTSLAAAWGVSGCLPPARATRWKRAAELAAGGQAAVDAALFKQLKTSLAVGLQYSGQSSMVGAATHAEMICRLLGEKIDLLKLDTEIEIPEPKSWAKLAADGAPKKPAEKKGAKRKGGKKPPSEPAAASGLPAATTGTSEPSPAPQKAPRRSRKARKQEPEA